MQFLFGKIAISCHSDKILLFFCSYDKIIDKTAKSFLMQQYAEVTLLTEFTVSLEEILTLNDTKELTLYLEMQLITMQEGILKFNRTNNHYIVEQAMMYISENYSHNITLDDMAAYLRISPFYLSRVFKKTPGKTLRMYLQKGGLKRQSVCFVRKKASKKSLMRPDLTARTIFPKYLKNM